MGSWVSICNTTQAILVVRLSQVTPLYYDYALMPGKCMGRQVGKVWFTVEAATRIFDGGVTTYERVGEEAFKQWLLGGDPLEFKKKCKQLGWTTVPTGYDYRNDIHVMAGPDLCYRYCLKSPGWYMGKSRRIDIVGGPSADIFTASGEYRQDVSMNEGAPPLQAIAKYDFIDEIDAFLKRAPVAA